MAEVAALPLSPNAKTAMAITVADDHAKDPQ
jgi:hypothetical protein